LPPWKGDYHHDLNTQMTYWPALTGNRLEAHLGFLDWLWDTRDECRRWTRQFYGLDGLAVPMTADLRNRQLGGWAPYTHSATSGAWLAHHFAMHWRMSADREFLEQRAYPYVREAADFLDALTRRDGGGECRRLRLTTSPEIGNNQREAWFDDWTNYDLALTRDLIASAAEMAQALALEKDEVRWNALLKELPELARDEDGGLSVAPGRALEVSHRHFSHQLAFHPLGRLSPKDPLVAPTLARLEGLGFENWMGYTFGWMAGLYAAVGRGDDAVRMLKHFLRGFRLPSNGFHTNGEIGQEKLTRWPFEAFTLEGNCAAMAAIQDLLLQSDQVGLHVFPALPADWRTASFTGLLAVGAVTVSASLADEQVEVVLLSPHDRSLEVQIGSNPSISVELTAGKEFRLAAAWRAEPQ
jgi:alpha-L-fucosidase 2